MVRSETLEERTKTAAEYVSAENKRLLRANFDRERDYDSPLNSVLYDVLYMLINSSADPVQKKSNYDLALAVCRHFEYPLNVFDSSNGFRDYYRAHMCTAEQAAEKVRKFLGMP